MDQITPKLDKSHLSVVSLDQSGKDLQYWLSKSPEERLNAIEINRELVYGRDKTSSRLQRVLEIAPFPQR